jgi:hypothetical protein
MVRLRAGDRVKCRISAGVIVSPYTEYDEVRTFEVVATDEDGCYLYVPHYQFLKGAYYIDPSRARKLKIESRFHQELMTYVVEKNVAGVESQMDGERCARCQEFCAMASPNQEDKTFLCWACVKDPFR